MSNSGGYYKYRCKYWLTYDCPHWVWVNGSPCAYCLAEGRESDSAPMMNPTHISRHIYVPQIENGRLQYIIMEIIGGDSKAWVLKPKPSTHELPVITTEPSAVTYSTSGPLEKPIKHPKSVLQRV